MTRGPADYAASIAGLLPQGDAWPREPGSALAKLGDWMGAELARVDGRVADLLREADPRLTLELLSAWEAEFGLPDPCMPLTATIAQRRAALLARMTERFSPTPASFIALAAMFGDAVALTEHRPHHCEMDCEQPVADPAWAHAWTVRGSTDVITDLTCEDHCELPLRQWQTGLYECAMRRRAPAHTVLIFAYA